MAHGAKIKSTIQFAWPNAGHVSKMSCPSDGGRDEMKKTKGRASN
jgi:hypothetical protein